MHSVPETSLNRTLSDSLLYSHSQHGSSLPPLPNASNNCPMVDDGHDHHCSDSNHNHHECADYSISDEHSSDTDEELSDWLLSDNESDHAVSIRSSTTDSHHSHSHVNPQQSDMRKQIVQIQSDPTIPATEKSKRIQVLLTPFGQFESRNPVLKVIYRSLWRNSGSLSSRMSAQKMIE